MIDVRRVRGKTRFMYKIVSPKSAQYINIYVIAFERMGRRNGVVGLN